MKYDLADILREAYDLYKNNKDLKQAFQNIEKVVNSILYSKSIYNTEEIKQQILGNLYISFHNTKISQFPSNSIWEECLNKNDETDKRLVSYFYDIIRTAGNEVSKSFYKAEGNRLYSLVYTLCNELVEENILRRNNKVYSPNNGKVLSPYNGESILFFHNILNENGTINSKLLKELIQLLFNDELENNYIELSSLVVIISNITCVGNVSAISKDQYIDEENSISYDSLLEDADALKNPEVQTHIDIILHKWLKRLQKHYTEEDRLELHSKIFISVYMLGNGYCDTVSSLQLNIGKSSVENYYKEFVRALEVNKDFTKNDEQLKYTLDAFGLLLNSKYRVIEV